MRIAVLGKGLAGLGAAYFLIKKGHEVVIFDKGNGASYIPMGICHPYPGRSGRVSKYAFEAIELTKKLIGEVEQFSGKKLRDDKGIIRKGWIPKERHSDLEKFEDGILIRSGITVLMEDYVNTLYDMLDVGTKEEYNEKEFDRTLLACGAGIQEMGFSLPLGFVKGQAIIGNSKIECERTVMKERGHLSPLPNGQVQLGSTYERNFDSPESNIKVALNDLSEKLDAFFPDKDEFQISECRAGIRVSQKDSYLPIVAQVDEKTFVFVGLGSRGLLYHAYYGRHLADMIV